MRPMAIDDHARASDDLERIEVQVMLEAIYQHYGFDFRGYAPGSLKRRLWRRAYAEKGETMSAPQDRGAPAPPVMERLLLALSINFTSMFGAPPFFEAMRQKVVPLLRTYPFIRIWNA